MRSILFTAVFALINLVSFGVCDPATITPSTPQTICAGGSVILSTAVLTNATYQWKLDELVVGTNSATYTATSGGSYTVTVSGAADGAGGTCDVSISLETIVTVNPLPTATITPASATTFCQGGSVVLNANTATGLTYQWKLNGNNITEATSSSYTSNASGSYTVVVTNANSCSKLSADIQVTVNPVATILNSAQTICSGAGFSGTPQNGDGNIIPTGTQYSWVVANDSVSGESNSVGMQSSIGQTLVNSTNNNQSVVYTITPQTGTCLGSSFTVTVTVSSHVIPNLTDPMDQSLCNGVSTNAVNFVSPLNIFGTSFSWTNSNTSIGLSQASGTGNINPFTSTNSTNSAISSTIVVTPFYVVSDLTCTGATQTFTILVNPTPLISNKTTTVCSTTAFTQAPPNGGGDIVPSGTTYTWAVGSNTNLTGQSAVSSAQNFISQTLANSTNTAQNLTYTVTPLSGFCPGSTFTVTVTVSPKPTISNKTSTICSATAFTQAPSNGAGDIVPSGTTYTWTVASNPNVLNETANNTAQTSISQTLTNTLNTAETVTYTVTPLSGSCPGSTFTVAVTLNPKPIIANNSNTTSTACSGSLFNQSPTNGNGDIVPLGTTYTWTIGINPSLSGQAAIITGQNSIGQTLTNSTNTSQNLTYTVTPVAGLCAGTSFNLIVTIKPKPSITSNLQQTICSEQPFTFIPVNITNGIVPASTTLTWTVNTSNVTGQSNNSSSGISAIIQTLTNTNYANNQVVYTVTPVANSCVGNSFDYTVTVNKAPNLIVTPTSTICNGNSIQLFAVDAFNSGQLFYNWSNANTLNSSFVFNPIATPQSNTTYTVSAIDNTTLCQVSRNVTVNVFQPVANISYNSPTSFCQGGSVTLSANGGTGLSYQWKLNDSAIPGATSVTYPAISSGVYTVLVTNSDGCSKTSNGQTVVVYPLPTASISSLSSTTFCAGESVILTTTALPGNSYQWYNGTSALGGATSATYTALTSGLYSVVVTNNTTCVAESPEASVTVNALPTLNISADDSELCVGESTSLHVTGASSYSWNPASLVSNSSNANPYVFPTATTNFVVTGTDQNGCSSYQEIQITVVPNPTLDLPNTIAACAGSIVSLPGSVAIDWSGITPISEFTAQQSGYAIATLQNSNLCTASDSIYLQVNPLPTPDITGADAVCANASNSEYAVISTGNAYSWNVSNGELQGIDNGNTAYIHWYDMEYGPSTFVTITEHNNITGCEGSDTLFVAFSGLAPNTTNVNLLDPSGSTLYSEDHYAIMNWGATIISNNVDEYTNGHAQYYTFENFDTALRYYWIEAGDDSLCLTRSYYNAPVWQVTVQEEQDFSEINLYPNPTSGYLNISRNSNFELVQVAVYDLAGKQVKQESNLRNLNGIDVYELPSGFYILKLQAADGKVVNETFVKE
jgi:hypothetical protein